MRSEDRPPRHPAQPPDRPATEPSRVRLNRYSLDGKSWSVLTTEAEAFRQRIAGLGVPTNIDDAACMLSLDGQR